MKNKIPILLIGNFPLLVEGFSLPLNRVGQVVGRLTSTDLMTHVPGAISQPQIIFVIAAAKDNHALQTIARARQLYPAVPVVLVAFEDEIGAVVDAIKAGVHGLLPAAVNDGELALAIKTLAVDNGYYFDLRGERLWYTHKDMHNPIKLQRVQNLAASSQVFLQLLCTVLSYEAMATKMQVGLPVIMQYKDDLSAILAIKSRVGMVLYAVKNGLLP